MARNLLTGHFGEEMNAVFRGRGRVPILDLNTVHERVYSVVEEIGDSLYYLPRYVPEPYQVSVVYRGESMLFRTDSEYCEWRRQLDRALTLKFDPEMPNRLPQYQYTLEVGSLYEWDEHGLWRFYLCRELTTGEDEYRNLGIEGYIAYIKKMIIWDSEEKCRQGDTWTRKD